MTEARIGTSALPGVGAIATGLFGALFVIVSQRTLGLDAFAPVAALWTMWALAAAAFTFSFQQITVINDDGHSSWRLAVDRGAWLAVGAVTVIAAASSLLGRERLFDSSGLVWPLLTACLPLGCAAVGLGRGLLASRRRVPQLAVLIASDNAIRLGLGLVLAWAAASSLWFGAAVVAGFVASVPAIRTNPAEPTVVEDIAAVRTTSARSGSGRSEAFGVAAIAGLLSYVLLNGSPLLLAAVDGDPADISTLFLLLTVVRVPYLIVQGFVPSLAVALRTRGDRPFPTAALIAVGLVVTVVSGALAVALGPGILSFLFDIDVAGTSVGAATAAGALSVTSVLLTVIGVANTNRRLVLGAWAVPLLAAMAWMLATGTINVDDTTTVLLLAEVAVLAGLAAVVRQPPTAPSTLVASPPA